MIDFENACFMKLKPVDTKEFSDLISPLLIQGETVLETFQGIRDGVVFTNKRIFAIDVEGLTGKKKDFSSFPYGKIEVFSVKTSGSSNFDTELELWFSGPGKIKFEFISQTDLTSICRTISEFVLK